MKSKYVLPLGLFLMGMSITNVQAKTLSEHITNLSTTNSVSIATDDPDHNIRYIGANPDNYVKFNNELWRIIGVFDGKAKLIRAESLGNYSWDSSDKTINGGLGVNNWAQADLMYELNEDYLNYNLTENTKWYNSNNNAKNANFDYTKTIKKDAQELIVDELWHTKSANIVNGEYSLNGDGASANSLYYYERNGKNTALNPGTSNSNDNTQRYDTWTGKVGLAYPSDILYATSGDDTISRETCISKSQWRHDNHECQASDWMVTGTSSGNRWLMSTFTLDGDNRTAYYWIGAAQGNQVAWASKVFPVVFLNSQVYITEGNGSSENPYQIALYHNVEYIDGEEKDTQRVENNSKATNKKLTKEDYTFLGWYEDKELTKEYDFDSIVNENKTLYSKWKFNYKITSGENQTHSEEDKEIVITTNGKLDNLVGIKVNGELLDKSNYKLESGSTILTLEANYLNSLNNDNYEIVFVYNDGEVGTKFTIENPTKETTVEPTQEVKEEKVETPKTLDNIVTVLITFILSLTSLITINKLKKQ